MRVTVFQSTLPVWGATVRHRLRVSAEPISIHAPRVGSDAMSASTCATSASFQSTPPGWGATEPVAFYAMFKTFQSTPPAWGATPEHKRISSCHTSFQSTPPRVGSDTETSSGRRGTMYFNPRPPRGERQISIIQAHTVYEFQSTPPAWGATESTCQCFRDFGNFNPRPPRGERRRVDVHIDDRRVISIHAPRVGSDSKNPQKS